MSFYEFIAKVAPPQPDSVLKLSDFYLKNPGKPTPWHERFAIPATSSYFMPLNYARLKEIFREVERYLPNDSVEEIWDFGSGLGTTQWVLEDQTWLKPVPLYAIETAPEARAEHKRLEGLKNGLWQSQTPVNIQPKPG